MIVSLGEGTSNQQPATSNKQQATRNQQEVIDHRRLLLKLEFQQEGYRLMNCSLDVDSR